MVNTPRSSAAARLHRRDKPAQSSLQIYLHDINDTELLNADEERILAGKVAEGDRYAREHMVKANLRLVVNIARGYLGQGLKLEDLIEEGNLGLMRAVEGFDGMVGTRFSTYASYWIKQSIRRAVMNNGTPVRIPAYMVTLLSKWRRASTILADRLGRNPSPEEIGKALQLSKKKLAIVAKVVEDQRFRQPCETGEGEDYLLRECPDDRLPPDLIAEKLESVQLILDRLDLLDDREATVLRLRFGLGEALPQTLRRVGESLGITRERVRQIEERALAKLAFFAGEDLTAGTLTVQDISRTNGKGVRRPRKRAKQSVCQPQESQGAEDALQANGTVPKPEETDSQANGTVSKPEETDSQATGTVQQFEETGLLTNSPPLKRFRTRVRKPAQAKLEPVDGESDPATIGATARGCQPPEAELEPIDGRNSLTSRKAMKAAKARGKTGRRRFVDPTTCERQQTPAEFQFGSTMRIALLRLNKLGLSPEEILLAAASLGYRYLPDPPPETQSTALACEQCDLQQSESGGSESSQPEPQEAPSQEIQTDKARRKTGRRRFVDPTTEGKREQWLIDLLLAIRLEIALADYKRSACRQFPTWSEVLEVMFNLGYRRVQVGE